MKVSNDYEPVEGLLRKLVQLNQRLRQHGLRVAVSEVIDAGSGLLTLENPWGQNAYYPLRSTLVKRSEDYPVFDLLFHECWLGEELPRDPKVESEGAGPTPQSSSPAGTISGKRTSIAAVRNESPGPSQAFSIYSATETRGRKKFQQIGMHDASIIRRRLRRFGRSLATEPGKRRYLSRKGALDLRASMRKSVTTTGEMTKLAYGRRKVLKPRLLVLCDISGSMDTHSHELLKLVFHLYRVFRHVDIFAFSTQVVHLNRYLARNSIQSVAEKISENVDIWSGGTRIGSALSTMLGSHLHLLTADTCFVMISDGWELGDIESLRRNLEAVSRRVHRVIWLNPLADKPGYAPLTLGMQTALPFVDLLGGTGFLRDPVALEKMIREVSLLKTGRSLRI